MAEEYLAENGLYFDEIRKRFELIDPEKSKLSESLVKYAGDYENSCSELVAYLSNVISSLEKMGQLVDAARKEMLGTQSALLLETSKREEEEREISEWIRDKVNEYERRRTYLESIKKQKNEHLEVINKMKN